MNPIGEAVARVGCLLSGRNGLPDVRILYLPTIPRHQTVKQQEPEKSQLRLSKAGDVGLSRGRRWLLQGAEGFGYWISYFRSHGGRVCRRSPQTKKQLQRWADSVKHQKPQYIQRYRSANLWSELKSLQTVNGIHSRLTSCLILNISKHSSTGQLDFVGKMHDNLAKFEFFYLPIVWSCSPR